MADDRVVHARPELFAAPTHGFAWIRMIGAILVIYGHSSPLVGTGELFPPEWPLQPDEGVLMGFFALSGFQITESWLRDPHPLRFAAKRVLRLWPPMLAVSLGVALIVGPLVTTLSTGEYFSSTGTWSYLLNNAGLLTLQHELPGVFTGNPWPNAVNGSLWTLPMELLAYGGLYTLLLLGAATRHRWLAVAALVVLVAFDRHLEHTPGPESAGSLLSVPVESLIAFLVAFAIGIVLNLYPVPLSPTAAIAGLAVLVAMPNSHTGSFWMTIAISYAVIVTGHYWPSRLEVPSVWVNGSYGVYVWSFPIQQLLAMAGVGNQFVMLLCAAPVAYVMGTLSWVFVEEPAMRLKNYVAPENPPRDARADRDEHDWDDEWDDDEWDDEADGEDAYDWADGDDWDDGQRWDDAEVPVRAGPGDEPAPPTTVLPQGPRPPDTVLPHESRPPDAVLPQGPRRDGRSVPPTVAPLAAEESTVARRLTGSLDPSAPTSAASPHPAPGQSFAQGPPATPGQPPQPGQTPQPAQPPNHPPTPVQSASAMPEAPVPQPPTAPPQPHSGPSPLPPGFVPGGPNGSAPGVGNGGPPTQAERSQQPVQRPGPRHRQQQEPMRPLQPEPRQPNPSQPGQPNPSQPAAGQPIFDQHGLRGRGSAEPGGARAAERPDSGRRHLSAERAPADRHRADEAPAGAHALAAGMDQPTGKHAAAEDQEDVLRPIDDPLSDDYPLTGTPRGDAPRREAAPGEQAWASAEGQTRPAIRRRPEYRRP